MSLLRVKKKLQNNKSAETEKGRVPSNANLLSLSLSPLVTASLCRSVAKKQGKGKLERRRVIGKRMQPVTRRRAINGVVPGSVWESRMKMDEVRGGIKVFNAAGESHDDEEGLRAYRRLRRNQGDVVGAEKRKRRSWKEPEALTVGGGSNKSPIQLRKARSVGVAQMGVALICDGRENKEEKEEYIEIYVEKQRESFDDKEMNLPVEKEQEVEELRKVERVVEIPVSPQSPLTVAIQKKEHEVLDLRKKDHDPLSLPQGDEVDMLFENIYGRQHRMQHIVDLVMWRDISKSAFVFGFGTFIVLSSSYAKDFNFSFISAFSYLGLLYLAVIFVFRSIIRRGEAVEFQEGYENYLLGEEEAIWILRRLLPYANEMLIRIRSLFSGEPRTTMKMAVLLFVMARCGSSVTIWSLAKMAFFGVFTIPKVLSSYSVQLNGHGKFWLARFRDGWESCTHKKAVAAAVFTLIWNLSSSIARIWAVFMLVVVVRLYQQCLVVEGDGEELHHEQQLQQQQQQRAVGFSPGHPKRQVEDSVKPGLDVNVKKVT